MEIIGIIMQRSAVQEKTQSFSVQHFYLDASTFNQNTGDKYENYLKFQVINGKIEELAKVQDGMRVKVSFNPRGRFFDYEGETKHAQDLTAWKFEVLNQNGALTKGPEESTAPSAPATNVYDDLPF